MKTLRPTLKIGAKGEHVRALQAGLVALGALGLVVDGDFGRVTDAALRTVQARAGLVVDGVAGPKVWALLGETWAAAPTSSVQVDMRAPACVAALRDANARWPKRSRISDGIMGDARHQAAGTSDHNVGNAVDITHDPRNGCDAGEVATMALRDPRTRYVIWAKQIRNVTLGDKSWRPYFGSNPHEHHCHVSIIVSKRDDASPWPWAVSS